MRLQALGMFFLALPFGAFAEPARVPVEFVFRNASSRQEVERRTVQIQGLRGEGFRLDAYCGGAGERCECALFRGEQDRQPLRSAGSRYEPELNLFRCTIPGGPEEPSRVTHASVRLRQGQELTSLLPVRDSLDLPTLLGPGFRQELVRSIFHYSCGVLFFEGEGVGEQQLSCVPGQRLGVISARYSYYTFRSGVDSNSPGGDAAFPGGICGRNNLLRYQCTDSVPELKLGLYAEPRAPFVAGVRLVRAPEDSGAVRNYGYAALPDAYGVCPPGLVGARPYVVQPESSVGGDLDGANPPSNFLNRGNLNNSVLETATPAPFLVTRQASVRPCDSLTGDCSQALFDTPRVVRAANYHPAMPVVCVIPPSVLGK